MSAVGSPLFPGRLEREAHEDRLTRALLAAADRVAAGPVVPTAAAAERRNELAKLDFHTPRPLDEMLAWTIAQLEHGVTHVTHPCYFGLFNPAPAFPGQCADRIVSTFNPQLASATTSPAAVEIEAHVIRKLAQRAGLPNETVGHFTSGGAEANFTALICALTEAHAEYAAAGARVFAGPPVFYASRDSHLAWLKIAHQAGIGRSAVRFVDTDGRGRMDPVALSARIAADRVDGAVPVMIAATAGTTVAGMIDPLPDCAEIARNHGLWLHIDAAWGGALIVSDSLRHALAGLEAADSVTIDAHKWFAATMGCGMFFSRRPHVLPAAFGVATGYMPSHDTADPYLNSVQWSRRFLGLRLFLSLAVAGWEGYARHVEHSVAMIALLNRALRARGWSIVNESAMAVLCAEPPPGSLDVTAIVSRVLASGRAWVSAARFEGRQVLRACVTHGETTQGDIANLADALAAACRPAACSGGVGIDDAARIPPAPVPAPSPR